jgi:hypothetical protein
MLGIWKLLAAATILALVAPQTAAAAPLGANSPENTDTDTRAQRDVTRKLELLNSRISSSFAGQAVPGGEVFIDEESTLKCPASAARGCIIIVETHVQVGQSSTSNNRYSICPLVGGLSAGCPYAGVVPTGIYYEVRSWAGSREVTSGTHSVRTRLITEEAARRGYYTIRYEIHKIL